MGKVLGRSRDRFLAVHLLLEPMTTAPATTPFPKARHPSGKGHVLKKVYVSPTRAVGNSAFFKNLTTQSWLPSSENTLSFGCRATYLL